MQVGRWGFDQLSAQVYSPLYLFKGTRPAITAAPAQASYGSTFTVSTPDASRIATVSLIRPGSVTHAFNQDQRFVPLTFQAIAGGLSVQAPANANLAPPGYYMLFIVDTDGIPSVGTFVQLLLPAGDLQPPTPPTNLNATGSVRAVSLTWSAATDNVGVTGYNVHRSTSSGFVPTTGNRIATPTGTSYINNNLAPGTYYYVVTAKDAAGNGSTPSPQASATVLPDTTAPSISITAPTADSTVSGAVTVTAAVSDDIAVSSVQFLLDGAALGSLLNVNGVQVASRAVAGSIPSSTGPLRIGGNSIWGEFFKGRIDEVRLYNRALSQAEIQSFMNLPLP